jgi:hypothetical protein
MIIDGFCFQENVHSMVEYVDEVVSTNEIHPYEDKGGW